jgi:hypothetical protein
MFTFIVSRHPQDVRLIQKGLLPKPSPTPREICVTCRATSYWCSIVENMSSEGFGADVASGLGALETERGIKTPLPSW